MRTAVSPSFKAPLSCAPDCQCTDSVPLVSTSADLQSQLNPGNGAAPPVPIEQHSLLSDQRTAAIVTPDARVVWLCDPRIDSRPLLAELLGGPAAGYFAVRPLDAGSDPVQRYVGHSMTLETSWNAMSVTDYLDCSEGLPDEPAGRNRLVRALTGTTRAVIEFAPRFGRMVGALLVPKGDDVVVMAGARLGGDQVRSLWLRNGVRLRSPGLDWRIESDGRNETARAEVDLSAGPVVVELLCGIGAGEYESPEPERRSATIEHWSAWAGRLVLPPLQTELVR